MANTASSYLEYLDKEMTIMGILSTFCVAVVALVLDRVGSADLSKATVFSILWATQSRYIVIGSSCVALAAALFYVQRSALAWYYGQITLSIESPPLNKYKTQDRYKDADSWATWIPYQSAFTVLAAGFFLYAYALTVVVLDHSIPAWVLWAPIGAGGLIQAVRLSIFGRYKYCDDPIAEAWLHLRGR